MTKNAQAEAMWIEYEAGASLSGVAALFGGTRQTVYIMFKRRGWPLRPKPALLPHVEWNGARYTMRNTGYLAKTTGKRTLLHRDIWESIHGPIPAGFDVHHIDHNRTNNDPANLELISKSDHTRLHAAKRKLAS